MSCGVVIVVVATACVVDVEGSVVFVVGWVTGVVPGAAGLGVERRVAGAVGLRPVGPADPGWVDGFRVEVTFDALALPDAAVGT